MEPNVRLLRYFLAVADAGTFTAAAEVLHVSQPALSQQIRKLEGELGFTLFQRGTRHVTLTPHGQDLISSAPPPSAYAPTPPRGTCPMSAPSTCSSKPPRRWTPPKADPRSTDSGTASATLTLRSVTWRLSARFYYCPYRTPP